MADTILKYDYCTVSMHCPEQELKELGKKGWEAVGAFGYDTINKKLLLKRPCGELAITKHYNKDQNVDYER